MIEGTHLHAHRPLAVSMASGGHGRWSGVARGRAARGKTGETHSRRYELILANDSLETTIQNDMSPFPPTYTEHVSRREVAMPVRHDGELRLPPLREIALRVVAQHFSTHILPTPEVLAALPDAPHRAKATAARPTRKRTRHGDELYASEEVSDPPSSSPPVLWASYEEALAWTDFNRDLLKQLPPLLMDRLLDAVCLYSPLSLTKEVLMTYFLPYAAPSNPRAPTDVPAGSRVRVRMFLPASLPLFTQNHSVAPLMLASLAGSWALAPSAPRLTAQIHAIDLHGHTRLQNATLLRLVRAPRRVPTSLPAPWQLQRVTLPGCTALGDAAVVALVEASGSTLLELNVTMTAVTPACLHAIGVHCPRLHTLRMAWCEQFTEESVSETISECIAACAAATPPRIPFQTLTHVDMAHTLVGDVAIGGLLRVCGSTLTSLDVGYTLVGQSGYLDVLCMGLGLGSPGMPSHVSSRLEHLGIAGLAVHSGSLLDVVDRLLPAHGRQGALHSLDVNDLVEYVRRHQSSLQGRNGIAGPALHALATRIADAAALRATPWTRLQARGDKRRAHIPGQWIAPVEELYTLGDSLALLFASCKVRRATHQHVDLSGLQMPVYDMDRTSTEPYHSLVETLYLNATGLHDEALDSVCLLTGQLTALYLDDTPITCTFRVLRSRRPRSLRRGQPPSPIGQFVAVPRHPCARTPRLLCRLHRPTRVVT